MALQKTIFFSLAFVVASPSFSQENEAPKNMFSSGWLSNEKSKSFGGLMSNQRMIPIKIECRDIHGKHKINKSIELKIDYIPNQNFKRWRWIWGRNFEAQKRKLAKSGWEQVSDSRFRRPTTGLLVRCGIFHKF